MKDSILDFYDNIEVTKKEGCMITIMAFLLGVIVGIALAPIKKGITVKVFSDNKLTIGNQNNKVKESKGNKKKHGCCK